MQKFLNFLLFQAVWFLCILGAAHEYELLASAIGILCVVANLFLSNDVKSNALLIVKGVLIGIVADTMLIHLDLMTFKTQYWTVVSPLWMWVLWAGFMSTINVSLSWLKPYQLLAALLGGIFGPLSYWAGVRMGAGSFGGLYSSPIAIGVMWAAVTPLLMRLSKQKA